MRPAYILSASFIVRKAAILGDRHPISTALFDRELQLSVIEKGEVYPSLSSAADAKRMGPWSQRGSWFLSILRTGMSGQNESRTQLASIKSTHLCPPASADFLVMGGYGHSRLREFVLGGVTRGILTSMTVPTLMSH